MNCPKCGKPIAPNSEECPECGIIFAKYQNYLKKKQDESEKKQNTEPISKEQESASMGKKEKKFERVKKFLKNSPYLMPTKKKVVSALLVVVILGMSGYFYRKHQVRKDYIHNLNLAFSLMTLSSVKCLEMCGKYSEVWRLAINNNLDFNTMLGVKRWSFENSGVINAINESKELIESTLRNLNSSPELYPETHKKIINLYGIYAQINTLASSPTGSLMTYNAQINNLQSEYIQVASELKVLLPKE